MNIFKKYIDYLKDNPEGYWFKRKLYGWGWTPATRQGWLVILIGLAILAGSVYIAEIDDAPGMVVLGVTAMVTLFVVVGYKKGEKPKWMWGFPKKDE